MENEHIEEEMNCSGTEGYIPLDCHLDDMLWHGLSGN
jgi:hypothetical protein